MVRLDRFHCNTIRTTTSTIPLVAPILPVVLKYKKLINITVLDNAVELEKLIFSVILLYIQYCYIQHICLMFHTCIIIDAVTLVPLSITTCPSQTVMFNCTSYGIPITWSVFTPSINYTDLEISDANRRLMDGVIMADLIALDVSTMPITVVSSLTVNLNLMEVKCSV